MYRSVSLYRRSAEAGSIYIEYREKPVTKSTENLYYNTVSLEEMESGFGTSPDRAFRDYIRSCRPERRVQDWLQ